ncbi:cysteine--tRNA ligase [Candidatus Falkowbacteria bacterium]|nr:cysteine--tRNA ligase [Candidatus Falkowbacteria bacterium]
MKKLQIYNTLSRKKEEFEPIYQGKVGLYTCGPTVYNFAHIGNLRTYLFEDFLKRVLEYNGYEVKHVMNITDVGHLTGDGDMGEDKLELGAAREGKTAWELADFYTKSFVKDIGRLNIIEPNIWCKATDCIPEQIAQISELESKGFTYKTSDGVYFDTSKIDDYNKLSHLPLETLQEGARVEKNEEKKNPTDFALWKFSPKGVKRQMEWQSPWGVGFPGWHIECSAMSLKFLDSQLDIHCGGIDHINVHHTNEIAQAEAATGEKFFNYWMHGAFLNISGGKKMAKSDDNFLTLKKALIDKGFNPLAYRFAALSVHYHKPMEYSEEAFANSQKALANLYRSIASLGTESGAVDSVFKEKFLDSINDDLNMPQALAMVYEVLKSDLRPADQLATILDFDRVLGLDLKKCGREDELPEAIKMLIRARQDAKQAREWEKSDALRTEIESCGYVVEDGKEGMKVYKKV